MNPLLRGVWRLCLPLAILMHFAPVHRTIASAADTPKALYIKSWYAGQADCSADIEPPLEVYRYSATTSVLRQNKCLHYEAPFIYLLIGGERALLIDTGATASAADFPLAQTVYALLAQHSPAQPRKPLIVAHSHNHSDHIAADGQFSQQANTVVIAPELAAIQQYFAFSDWPQGQAPLDLGQRLVTVVPIPGHQAASIAFYDHQSGLLFTGDTLYPGRLYIRDWPAYKDSIARLRQLAHQHPVQAILGAHIEMQNRPGQDYPIGSTHHADEHPLALSVDDLHLLHQTLNTLGDTPRRQVLDNVIIAPLDD